MDWIVNYVLPMLITVISGVLVYMCGELLNTIWLKPLQDYKLLKNKRKSKKQLTTFLKYGITIK